jgi:succinate dehydrogenase hydrophobic anchor subunit
MSFLAELLADLFGWFGLDQARKDFVKGNKKRATALLVLFLIMLSGIFVYIIYGIIQFFKTY